MYFQMIKCQIMAFANLDCKAAKVLLLATFTKVINHILATIQPLQSIEKQIHATDFENFAD